MGHSEQIESVNYVIGPISRGKHLFQQISKGPVCGSLHVPNGLKVGKNEFPKMYLIFKAIFSVRKLK